MTNKRIISIFNRLQKKTPHPKTELIYNSAYQLLIAVILSAQSTDQAVNRCTKHLFQKAPNACAMIEKSIEEIALEIRTLGLYQSKSKYIWHTSRILVEKYHGDIPDNLEELMKLPGVGRKTANVILNTLFNAPVIAVDTHVFRVSARLHLAQSNNVYDTEKQLEKTVPLIFKQNAHHWLILHGRYVCRAKNPLCVECTLNDLCPSKRDSIKKK